MKRHAVVAGCLAALVTGCHASPQGAAPTSPTERAPWQGRVLAVLDGDTIDVDHGGQRVRVRLLSIDAPEIAHDGTPAACGGDAARRYLDGLVWHREVTVAPDSAADLVDRYGRTLAYVYVGQLDAGMAEVSDGYAESWHPASSPTPSRQDSYRQAESLAHQDKRGSWRSCPVLGRPTTAG